MTERLVRAAVATFAAVVVAACGGSGTSDAPAPVPHVAVTGATLGETSTSLVVGATERLVATVAPPDATDPRVTWSTSDARIADVTTSGVVLGVGVGVAVITATTVDGGFAASCAVTVQPSSVAVTGVSVAPVLLELDVELVPTGLLTATVAPSNATDRRVTWTSSDARIATVSDTGVVTGVQRGSAVVIATTVDGGKLAGAVVSVTEPTPAVVPVASVSLGKASTTLEVGASAQLVASVLPAAAAEKRVVWSTSNDRIVSVTALGRITGVGKGTATITATTIDGGKTARCEVTVTSTAVAITGVTLDQTTLSLPIGSATTLKASVAPTDAPNQALTWDITPWDVARLQVVGNTATITGLKLGVATVTVTSHDDPGLSATATVHVTPVAVSGVALSFARLTLTAPPAGTSDGTSAALTAVVAPSDATDPEVQWTTSDALVATLSSTSGSAVTVVAHHQGSATVTVTTADGGKTARCEVTVEPAPGASTP